jgi:hypothetical protein
MKTRSNDATSRAVSRAQSIYLEQWNDALLADLFTPKSGRSDLLETVVKSLAHAKRAWIAYGHSPESAALYYKVGELAEEHTRAARLVEVLKESYERQDAEAEVAG